VRQAELCAGGVSCLPGAESPGMFGTGVADYALEPRYAELLWEVSTSMLRVAR
jgi:hypothetical protein